MGPQEHGRALTCPVSLLSTGGRTKHLYIDVEKLRQLHALLWFVTRLSRWHYRGTSITSILLSSPTASTSTVVVAVLLHPALIKSIARSLPGEDPAYALSDGCTCDGRPTAALMDPETVLQRS